MYIYRMRNVSTNSVSDQISPCFFFFFFFFSLFLLGFKC